MGQYTDLYIAVAIISILGGSVTITKAIGSLIRILLMYHVTFITHLAEHDITFEYVAEQKGMSPQVLRQLAIARTKKT